MHNVGMQYSIKKLGQGWVIAEECGTYFLPQGEGAEYVLRHRRLHASF